MACQKYRMYRNFGKSTHFRQNDLFEGVRVTKNEQNFLRLPVMHKINTTCKKFGPNRSFEPSGVPKAIYNAIQRVPTVHYISNPDLKEIQSSNALVDWHPIYMLLRTKIYLYLIRGDQLTGTGNLERFLVKVKKILKSKQTGLC